MNKIISFKKDLLFKTKVHNIESIDLIDHTNISEDHSFTGIFEISGDYKMTIASVNRESFTFKLPFDIAVDPKYDVNEAVLEITDFRYELINNEILRVNIEVSLNNLILKQDRQTEVELEQNIEQDIKQEIDQEVEEHNVDIKQPVVSKTEITHPNINISSEHEDTVVTSNLDDVKSIFNNISNEEKYVTYNVYQFNDGDDINDIVDKYETDIEVVRSYNNLNNLKPGDKIIIPRLND